MPVSLNKLFAGFFIFYATASNAQHISDEMHKTTAQIFEAAAGNHISYEIVKSLTTEIGPRLAGTAAEKRARDWAVSKLTEMGFSNVRVDPFDTPLWQRVVEEAEITAPYPQKLTITALGGSLSTPKKGVEGEIIVFPSLAVLKKQEDDSLRGKIVFVDEVMTRTQDGSGYGVAVAKRYGTAFEAARTGAVAALIRSVGTSNNRFAHTGMMRTAESGTKPNVPLAALSAPDADQLTRIISQGSPVRVRLKLRTDIRPSSPSGNVIAEIPGREKPEEVVLIGAHLDSWDLGTGAVDDGAGVGIVVGAAKILLDTLDQAPRRTIRIVLFGAEEVGIVGGKAYVEKYADNLSKHIIAAESDFGADKIWRFDAKVSEDSRDAISEIQAVLSPLGIGPGKDTAAGGPDLRYLRDAGVPIAGLIQNGWDYFDLHHTPNDTLDKIDAEKLNQNTIAYAIFAYLIAEIDTDFR